MPTDPPQFLRIYSPYGKQNEGPTWKKLTTNVPAKEGNEFFQGTLCTLKGAQYHILSTMFHALKSACDAAKIPTTYDLDNEQRVAAVLSRINFTDLNAATAAAYKDGYNAGLVAGRGVGRDPESNLGRGATGKPDRSKPGRTKRRPAAGVHNGNATPGNKRTDSTGTTEGRVGGSGKEATQDQGQQTA